MFTGLVEQIGVVVSVRKDTIIIRSHYIDLKTGESIAVDGMCLTVEKFKNKEFSAHISEETLSKTTFSYLKKDSQVHLERAIAPAGRFGGHIVQGHVDGIGEIVGKTCKEQSIVFTIQIPEELITYIAQKGSIACDGISLTIASINGRKITVAVIPHTLKHTHWESKKVGSRVNIETDVIAKYVERQLLQSRMGNLFQKKELDVTTLIEGGFE